MKNRKHTSERGCKIEFRGNDKYCLTHKIEISPRNFEWGWENNENNRIKQKIYKKTYYKRLCKYCKKEIRVYKYTLKPTGNFCNVICRNKLYKKSTTKP